MCDWSSDTDQRELNWGYSYSFAKYRCPLHDLRMRSSGRFFHCWRYYLERCRGPGTVKSGRRDTARDRAGRTRRTRIPADTRREGDYPGAPQSRPGRSDGRACLGFERVEGYRASMARKPGSAAARHRHRCDDGPDPGVTGLVRDEQEVEANPVGWWIFVRLRVWHVASCILWRTAG
jgi:hypothetical protein